MTPGRQFGLFVLTGGAAALLNIGSRVAFSRWLPFESAVLAAYAIGMVTAYVLARRVVFRGRRQPIARSFAAFALVNLVAVLQTWLVSVGLRPWLLSLVGAVGLADLLAHATGVIVPIFTSFLGHKHISFKDTPALTLPSPMDSLSTAPVIAVFDVDGTLLRGDCFRLAARGSRPPAAVLRAAVALLPGLLAWRQRRISTGDIKEKALALFGICDRVNHAEAAGRPDWLLPALCRGLRPEALQRLRWHQQRGDRVLLCSASPRMLLQPLADWLGVELLATELQQRDGRWQPRLAGANCKGPEKVRRLQAHLGSLEGVVLEAYGDSPGDRELLLAVQRPHYRSFRPEPRPYPTA